MPFAMRSWAREMLEDDEKAVAAYFVHCISECLHGETIVWNFLKKTGHKEFTQETFLNAADWFLKNADQEYEMCRDDKCESYCAFCDDKKEVEDE